LLAAQDVPLRPQGCASAVTERAVLLEWTTAVMQAEPPHCLPHAALR